MLVAVLSGIDQDLIAKVFVISVSLTSVQKQTVSDAADAALTLWTTEQ